MAAKGGIFIAAAKRTAFGTFGGTLKNHSATDLATIAAQAALKDASLEPEHVDHIVFGNVIQSSKDSIYLSRHVGLKIGLQESTPAVVVNRLCGSGFQSIVDASHQIISGDSQIVISGGTESMSQSPFIVRGTRFGTTLGKPIEFEDSLWSGLTDSYIKTPMGLTAEKLGAMYKVTRADADNYALQSQTRWKLANGAGYFKSEITPITLKSKKGEVVFATDEHPRPATIEALGKLPPVFQKDGLVTAGTASGICDGAAAVVVASEEAVKAHKLQPLVRIVGWHVVGCDNTIMGIGPVPAIRGLLKKTKMTLDQMDYVEVNEAFAAQALAVQRELKVDNEKFNVNGGAIALGHPLAASGTRIVAHMAHELVRTGKKYAITSACIGGGQGIAVLLERV
uniref:3-ketoacyl-CoA thiolase, mitochondrial n=1 Tax=Rhabditophanes sp. KR3021 TaxID=114890 RepID=A0AC35U7K7_9BILA